MRTPADIEQAIRNQMAARARKAAERDRQERNMRTALAEVERLEGQMQRDLDTIENLYAELDESIEATIDAIADAAVRP